MDSVIPPSGRIQLLQERTKALKSAEKRLKMKAKAKYFSFHFVSVIMKGTNESIFPKALAQCVPGRIRSLSLDSGVGLMLHNFGHLHYLFVHFLLSRRLPKHLWNSQNVVHLFCFKCLPEDEGLCSLLLVVKGSDRASSEKPTPSLIWALGEQTQLEIAEGLLWNPLPLPPALDFEKLCRSGEKESQLL